MANNGVWVGLDSAYDNAILNHDGATRHLTELVAGVLHDLPHPVNGRGGKILLLKIVGRRPGLPHKGVGRIAQHGGLLYLDKPHQLTEAGGGQNGSAGAVGHLNRHRPLGDAREIAPHVGGLV